MFLEGVEDAVQFPQLPEFRVADPLPVAEKGNKIWILQGRDKEPSLGVPSHLT